LHLIDPFPFKELALHLKEKLGHRFAWAEFVDQPQVAFVVHGVEKRADVFSL
jgi:hypothetical protein